MHNRLNIIAFVVIFLPAVLFGQNTVLKHYSLSEGMPSSECYEVTKDSRGYLWIGTDAGIVRYDGYGFKTYNNSNGLKDNTVFKILEGKDGKVWFLTYSGRLFYYHYNSDSIYGISANKALSETIKRFPIDFELDDNGRFYISNYTSGYIEVSPPYDKIKSFSKSNNTYFLKEIDSKHFLFGRDFKFDGKRPDKISLIFYPEQASANYRSPTVNLSSVITHVWAIKSSPRSYIFSDGTSLFMVSKDSVKVIMDSMPGFNSKGMIISLFQDKENRVWVNTAQHGTFVYENGNFQSKPMQFLENSTVSGVCEDGNGGYWITTIESGLYYLPSLELKFLNRASGLSSDKTLSIFKYKNWLYALTIDNTLNAIDLSQHKISVYSKHQSSAWNLVGKDSVMIDCGNYPVMIELDTKKTIPLWRKSITGLPIEPSIRKAIDFNAESYLGFGIVDVFTINKKTAECVTLYDNFPTIFSIYKDENRVLVGTKDGLYSIQNNKVEYLGDLHPLLTNRIVDITKANGFLFLATKGAGVVCLKDDKVLKVFNETNGLPSNVCKSMVRDEEGNVWVGTNRGLFGIKMKHGNLAVNGINVIKSFISSEINQVIATEGTLYFATSNGVGLLDVNELYSSNTTIPVYIEGFWVNGVKQRHDTNLTFDHEQNTVKIEYKGISQKREGDLKYRYKIEGLDTSWVYTHDIQVQLSLLPPGKYTFIVYVLNENGFYSKVPAKLSFRILAPFWTKWWFYAIELFIVSFLIYFLYRRRILVIKRAEEEKTIIYKQIAESELTALRAQMNPHFIFNAINSIQNFILKHDTNSAHKYLTKFARLIRSVLENSKRDVILLSHEIESLTLYIELEALRASFSFDFSISVHTDTNPETVLVPPMLIQPFVENAILHGLMPLTDKRGKLSIEFSQEENILKCIIDDNGIGRAAAEEIKMKKSTTHVSMGTSVTQQRLDILNKQNGIPTQVKIIDKVVEGVPTGTLVEICIELKKK